MSIKHKIKFKKIDRDRGTSSAVLRSSGPKHSAERPASKLGVSDGESTRRGVPANDMKQPVFVNEDEEYCKHLARFFKGEVE